MFYYSIIVSYYLFSKQINCQGNIGMCRPLKKGDSLIIKIIKNKKLTATSKYNNFINPLKLLEKFKQG